MILDASAVCWHKPHCKSFSVFCDSVTVFVPLTPLLLFTLAASHQTDTVLQDIDKANQVDGVLEPVLSSHP